MKKWNIVIDVAECTNCNLCTLSAQDEYVGNEWPGVAAEMPKHGHRWIDIKRKERGQPPLVEVAYMPVMCQHCDDAPCIKAAENGAVTKRDDGIVIIDPEKSKGQKAIMEACPYDAVFWNDKLNIPQAWPFDAHLLDGGWEEPRAVTACPTGAFKSLKVEDSEMARLREAESLKDLDPAAATKPRVHYKNLYLFRKFFAAGTVAGIINGRDECIKDATISLSKGDKATARTIAETTTDAFGDFKIDRLDAASDATGDGYHITITKEGFQPQSVDFDLKDSLTLDVIRLEAKKGA
ncbi:MAG: oxidoreductase [Rhodospirillales bacterium]|nr:oxidoreductase [Rhodospirillales bacterium]